MLWLNCCITLGQLTAAPTCQMEPVWFEPCIDRTEHLSLKATTNYDWVCSSENGGMSEDLSTVKFLLLVITAQTGFLFVLC